MFTGIVRGVGSVLEQRDAGGDRRLVIDVRDVPRLTLEPGDSIAVSGVCLTAAQCAPGRFTADVSMETLAVTTLGALAAGAKVNLEPAVRLGETLDGHWVTGHVDGTGRVVAIRDAARSQALTIEAPEGLARYLARKGSVAVDGVSLTVNAVQGARFEVNIVPHTRQWTIMARYEPGTAVNIEVDVIARYLERLMSAG